VPISVPAIPAPESPGAVQAAVDLGEIHQAAVTTNTGAALVVSGRGIRSLKRRHHLALGQLARKGQRSHQGSQRWRNLQRARRHMSARKRRQIRALRHQGPRKGIAFCQQQGVGRLFIGTPDGVRKQNKGPHHNQRLAVWEYGQDSASLTSQATIASIERCTGSERGTASQGPVGGWKHRVQGRHWRCRNPEWALSGHRDGVGSLTMHPLAFGAKMAFPARLTYQRAGPGRVLARSKQPRQVQGSPPVVGARTRATRRA
jgi:putative transposase